MSLVVGCAAVVGVAGWPWVDGFAAVWEGDDRVAVVVDLVVVSAAEGDAVVD
jgi:hypothetical protein